MKNKNYDKLERPTASMGWVLVGLVFGILGLIVAKVTDKGDGRVSKTLVGCIIWLPIAALGTLIVFALLGPVVGNELSNIVNTLSPTIAPPP